MVASAAIAAGGALANMIGGLASNANAVSQQKAVADYSAALNWKYAKKNALKMPFYNRRGLEKAGYNPMLALGGLSESNSNWTSNASPFSTDFSHIGNGMIDAANSLQQQENQNRTTDATIDNYNADTELKKAQSVTEFFDQILKQNQSDVAKHEATLKSKEASWYDKRQAKELLKMDKEIERWQVLNKVDLQNALSNQISAFASQSQAQASLQNANTNANALDVKKNTYTYSGNLSAGPGGLHGQGAVTGYKPLEHIYNSISNPPDNKHYTIKYEYINGRKVPVKYFN